MNSIDEHGYSEKQSTWIISSQRGQGKTQLILDRLGRHYKGKFERVYWLSPSALHDDKVLVSLRKASSYLFSGNKEKEKVQINVITSPDSFLDYIRMLSERPPHGHRWLMVLDDGAWFQRILKSSELTRLVFNARHSNVDLWISTQKMKSLPTLMRCNATEISMHRNPNRQEVTALCESYPVQDEEGHLISDQDWKDMYYSLTNKKYGVLNLAIT